jgi:DNA-binding IclR family transcriptional regulator
MDADRNGRRVKSLERMFDLVEVLVERNGARVTDLAEELDVAKSSVHSYLSTMVANGYAVKKGSEYYAGLRFLTVGGHLRERHPGYALAEPIVEDLAATTKERAQFIVEENGRGVFIHRSTGPRAVDADTRLGKRIFLHSTGAGKAILAALPDQRVDEILDRHGLPARTEFTITERSVLDDELRAVKDRGYAVNKEEGTTGLRSVAAPVLDGDDRLFGAISVSGPSRRLTDSHVDTEVADTVTGSANELELKLTHL